MLAPEEVRAGHAHIVPAPREAVHVTLDIGRVATRRGGHQHVVVRSDPLAEHALRQAIVVAVAAPDRGEPQPRTGTACRFGESGCVMRVLGMPVAEGGVKRS